MAAKSSITRIRFHPSANLVAIKKTAKAYFWGLQPGEGRPIFWAPITKRLYDMLFDRMAEPSAKLRGAKGKPRPSVPSDAVLDGVHVDGRIAAQSGAWVLDNPYMRRRKESAAALRNYHRWNNEFLSSLREAEQRLSVDTEPYHKQVAECLRRKAEAAVYLMAVSGLGNHSRARYGCFVRVINPESSFHTWEGTITEESTRLRPRRVLVDLPGLPEKDSTLVFTDKELLLLD